MIPSPLLVVTDRHGATRPLVETVRAVLDGGARWIWFRDTDLEAQARRDLARAILALVREAGGCLTIGGDAELAAAISADGVHLPFPHPHTEVPTPAGLDGGVKESPRGRAGGVPSGPVGISAHGLAEIRAAAAFGADYATLSPIFPTPSKPGYGPPLGLDALREAARLGIPVVALGGIGPDEARACREAGAAGVAIMGGLMRAGDPTEATRRYLDALSPFRASTPA